LKETKAGAKGGTQINC